MSIKQKIIIAVIAGGAISLSSCKKYLDVNKNPNILQNASVDVLLPTGEMYLASAVGVDLEINGSIWAQYWTQNPNSSQYKTLEQYEPVATTYETPWLNLYNAAENLYQMNLLAVAQNKKQYQAVSLILRAYIFQNLTDGWGDVPFSEALKGQPKDGNIINPHYDAQMAIYKGILSYLDGADTLINTSDNVKPGSDDLIYGGDMSKWQKFSNTLRLRILLRMSHIDPAGAQAGIAALYARSPFFIGHGDDAMINFSTTSGNKNPLYAESVGLTGTQNLVGSKTCIDSMNSNLDYRGFAMYESVSSSLFPMGVAPVGIAQGNYNAVVAANSFSLPSTYVAGDAGNAASATAPVKFITSYESYFLQAEAAARWSVGATSDSSLFASGIYESFYSYKSAYDNQNILWADTTGKASGNGWALPSGDTLQQDVYMTVDFAYYTYLNGDTTFETAPSAPLPAYWAQYPTNGSITEKLRYIITQKWFSMCGNQGFEAWCEWRRTGYPDFLVYSKNSQIGNQFPKRFIYPNSEITRNLNFPGLQPITAKVWWGL